MLDFLQAVFADVYGFLAAGYILVVHLAASIMSVISKSWSYGGSIVGNFFRRLVDLFALNIGRARNADAGISKDELAQKVVEYESKIKHNKAKIIALEKAQCSYIEKLKGKENLEKKVIFVSDRLRELEKLSASYIQQVKDKDLQLADKDLQLANKDKIIESLHKKVDVLEDKLKPKCSKPRTTEPIERLKRFRKRVSKVDD